MAKLKMKSVRIIALKKYRKRILEHIQNSELLHVESSEEIPAGFIRYDKSAQLKQFERNKDLAEQALKALDKISPEKKNMLASFRGREEIDPDEIGKMASKAPKIINICTKITELDKQQADYAAEKVRIRTSLVQLETWKKLDIPLSTKDTDSMSVFIGSFPRLFDDTTLSEALAQEAPELIFESEIVFSSSNITCAAIFTPKNQKETALNTLRSLGFTKPLTPTTHTPSEKAKRLEKRIQELDKKAEQDQETLGAFVKYREQIKDIYDYFTLRSEKYKVLSELDQTEHIFVLRGYIPEEDCEKLKNLCEKAADCVVEFEEADENAPVKLKNNAFAAPAESIVTMYSPPSKDDIDPTPVMAFFFYFFFGMMFSDAGYGVLMVAATTFIIKKFKPDKNMYNSMKLFQYCGISTILWGLIFGSIFGDAPAVIYRLCTGSQITMAELLPYPFLDTQKDALAIMILSIGFGLIHVLVGMGCKFYVCLRKKQYMEAFFDTGLWMTLLIGLAVLAAGIAAGPIVTVIGEGISVLSVIGLLLTQGRAKKGFFGKLIGGLASLYDITSYVSDLLSYSRLLALGLTTGVMAQVFNMLSTLLGTSIFGVLYMIVVFCAGHAITIGLNALGSYVHTMRLQYVEMFSKFYEGGGKPFEAFSLKTKQFKIHSD